MIKTQVNALTKKNRSFYEPLVDVVSRIDSRSQEESLNLAMSFFDSKFPITFNTIVCHLIYQYCVCQISCYDSYLNFLTLIKGAEEQIPNVNIIEMFCNLLLNINSKESDFLLEKMFEKGLINPNFVRYTKSLFFAHLMSPRTIRNLNDYDPYKDEYSGGVFWTDFFQNYQKLSENDWVLHKQLISEGNNPETITDIIKNDNVTKLREVSVVTNFDFDQKIKKSLYEKNSFINNDNVSLIDYAAFFGSIKCFNYLMSKDSNLKNTFKYAIAGGNLEILQSCYQNHSSPEGIFETAIEFHQNEIFHFFYEKEDINHDLSLSKLGTLCVRYSNYEIFSYLEKENMKIDDDIINEIATNGDLFLFNRFVEKRKLPKNVLFSAIKSGNVELVNYIIDKNEVDINEHLNNDMTPLILAIKYGYFDIVKLLLENNKTYVNEKDQFGCTALLAASKKGNIEILKIILEHPRININDQDNMHFTALIYASTFDYIDIVEVLLKRKDIDVNLKNNLERSAVMIASRYGYTEIVNLLLKNEEIKIGYKDHKGRTALIYACKNGNFEIAKLLLSHKGKHQHAADFKGKSALMYATEKGYTEIVSLFSAHKIRSKMMKNKLLKKVRKSMNK